MRRLGSRNIRVAPRGGAATRSIHAQASAGITLWGSEDVAQGAAPDVTVFWLHGLGDTADGWVGAFVPGGGIARPGVGVNTYKAWSARAPEHLNTYKSARACS